MKLDPEVKSFNINWNKNIVPVELYIIQIFVTFSYVKTVV